MRARDRNLGITVVDEATPHQPRVDAEIITANALFDRNFPETCRTEYEHVLGVIEQFAGLGRELFRLPCRPQKNMRVQQEFHYSTPNSLPISSCPIRSKSSGTDILPARNPNRRISPGEGESSATTFTIGFPDLAMTNGSPLAALSTSRDKLVFAS